MTRLVKVKLALPAGNKLLATENVTDASGQWQRRIKELTSYRRAVQLNRTFERGGFKLVIDDIKGDYKTMMENDTNRKIENCAATVYIYKADGMTLQETIVTSISSWEYADKELTLNFEQNFDGKLPQTPAAGSLKILVADWPYAPKTSWGKEVVFPCGVIYRNKGGMAAWRVDKKPVTKYLLTWSDPAYAARVVSVQAVYHKGAKVSSTKHTLVRDVNGWEYILYPKGIAGVIRVNLTANASLFSAGNPVDGLNEGLANLGITLVDAGNAFKTWCTASGWTLLGAPTELKTVREYIELWCQNFDGWWWIDAAGAVNIKHIDWASVTAIATLTERHFVDFKLEQASMDDFANRIKAKLDFDYGKNEWGTTSVVDSTTADILPASIPYEEEEEYSLADFSGAVVPMTNKLRYVDHPIYTAEASIDQNLYEQLGLSILSIVTITHYNQISGSGKYLIMSEEKDIINNTIIIKAMRLWGV